MKDDVSAGLSINDGSVHEGDRLSNRKVQAAKEFERESSTDASLAIMGPGCESITPEMLTLVELNQQQIDAIVASVPGGARNVKDIYPLSPLQEGMLFHNLLNQQSDTYVFASLFELQSQAVIPRFIGGLQKVIDRHDVLRTAVLWEKLPRPLQVVYRHAVLAVEELPADPDCSPMTQVIDRMKPKGHQLDLTRPPLMRLLVARGSNDAPSFVLLQAHHLVCDYQTRKTIIAETMTIMEGFEQQLPAPVGYRNYVENVLSQDRTKDEETFFRSRLGDFGEPTAPFGLLDVHGDGSHVEEASVMLDATLAQQVRAQAKLLGVSAARVFHAAVGLMVARTSGRDQAVYGTVLSSRQKRAQLQCMLGMSINTLPLRLRLEGISAKELVEQTSAELKRLLNNSTAPLSLAQRCSRITGTMPLFTVLLNYRRSVADSDIEKISAPGVRMIAHQGVWTNYPVALQIDDSADGINVLVQADVRIGAQRMIEYLKAAVHALTEALEHAPQTPALELEVLPEVEKRQITQSFNATRVDYAREILVHQQFERQVECTPDAVAVVCGTQQFTYDRLNRRANQVAHALIARGVRPDERVALFAERSIEMIVGLVGILKAGGAYVPMDVSYPPERLQHMLSDSAPVVLLTQERLRDGLAIQGVQALSLDSSAEIDRQSESNPSHAQRILRPSHLAYVIYTSGSTGVPKGVMVEHRNLMNLISWHCTAFELTEGCRSSSVAAVGFDAAGWEIWPPLLVGATLVLASSDEVADAERLLAWWEDQQLDVSFLPTPMAEFIFSRNRCNPRLRTLLVGGDRLRSRPASDMPVLINNYGPTETTVVATSGRINNDDQVLHIGRPIANTQIYILDGHQHVVPIGVEGELYIGGEGVARGYLNRPELTAQRFIRDPFNDAQDARLYRTGDMGRWRADGTIEYLGRNDYQVKIRGFRIELGEIEAQLMCHPQVKDAVVVVREDAPGEKHLVAYFVAGDEGVPAVEDLRGRLKASLPEYMVPSLFAALDRLPLTPNGKLDRLALPPPAECMGDAPRHEPPHGEVEQILAQIWKELMHVERVGRHDNFFELGGHSLLAVKTLSRINQAFDCGLKVTDLYRNPTMRDLAARISGKTSGDELIDLDREAVLDLGIVARPETRSPETKRILLTGGTGFVGRFLLAQLLREPDVTVYCLVRARSEHQAFTRLRTTLVKWNLWRSGFEQRIVAVPGDLSLPRLGIDLASYDALAGSIDTIYNCGTSMNHLETYAMAKPANVEAARMLLKFAIEGRPKLINHISTLSVFRSSDVPRVIDERSSIDQERHSTVSGYVGSKWVAEKIFMTAIDRDIPCNIFRVGLVWADTEQGRYDELQQGYRVFKSCLLSGYGIENYRYAMAPTPVDYVARAIVFLARRHSDGHGIFHIASSEQAIDGLFERCNELVGTSLEILPYYEWIHEMRRLHQDGRSLPVIPLIEFAFSMDAESFCAHQRSSRSGNIRFECSRTHRELEAAGILAPSLDDSLLKLYAENMFASDAEVRELMNGPAVNRPLTNRGSSRRSDSLSRSGT